MLRSGSPPRNHLLMPSHPTPNGRLHLGHIAGPYLKMDVLKRALERRGGRIFMAFAIDSYDSYVLLRAHHNDESPEAVVARFKGEIIEDLKAFDISNNIFVDPLEREWSQLYRETLLQSISALRSKGAIEIRNESFLWNPRSSRFITGCWLQGRCPGCGSDAGGYSCEACGLHYRPEEIIDARDRLNEFPLETVSMLTAFLHVRKSTELQRYIDELALPEPFEKIVRQYLDRSGPFLRITIPGEWGVPYTVDREPRTQVIFPGFASWGLLLSFGREFARRFSVKEPFQFDSDVVTVCSFGIDNTVSRMMSCVGGALEHANCRPPSHFLLNHFYRLEGAKFSTSRKHAIWASAIANVTPCLSDAIRLYLLETAPETSETDFRVDDFLRAANKLSDQWNSAIVEGLSAAGNLAQVHAAPDSLIQSLIGALDDQDRHLDLRSFRSRAIADSIYKWFECRNAVPKQSYYWWLKGLALIAWPALPKLSGWLWRHLGHEGDPSEREYLKPTTMRPDVRFQRLEPLTLQQLRGCLPDSLRS
jgi:methionyl-tRNA synthetase